MTEKLAKPHNVGWLSPFWGDRMCKLADPEGHNWCFATHVGE